jgi:hypothetical protein
MSDLDRLAWKAPQRACYALTYVRASTEGTKVVTLSHSKGPAASGGVEVRVRRTIVR